MIALPFAVAPVLVAPLQVLLAMLPASCWRWAGCCSALLRPSTIKTGLKLLWRQKIIVAGIAAVVGLGFYARTLLPGSNVADLGEQSDVGDDWPMFHRDLLRRGSSGTIEEPAQGGVNWSYAAD